MSHDLPMMWAMIYLWYGPWFTCDMSPDLPTIWDVIWRVKLLLESAKDKVETRNSCSNEFRRKRIKTDTRRSNFLILYLWYGPWFTCDMRRDLPMMWAMIYLRYEMWSQLPVRIRTKTTYKGKNKLILSYCGSDNKLMLWGTRHYDESRER